MARIAYRLHDEGDVRAAGVALDRVDVAELRDQRRDVLRLVHRLHLPGAHVVELDVAGGGGHAEERGEQVQVDRRALVVVEVEQLLHSALRAYSTSSHQMETRCSRSSESRLRTCRLRTCTLCGSIVNTLCS